MKTLKVNRKIESTRLEIDELQQWLGKEVDIIIREKKPFAEMQSGQRSVAGKLEKYQNADLMVQENNGWGKAVREKHGNRLC